MAKTSIFQGDSGNGSSHNRKYRNNVVATSAMDDVAGESGVSLALLSVDDAISALFKIPDPGKAIKDADAITRKARKKID